MNKTLILFLFCFASLNLFQQTKLIEHRSHSMNSFFSVFSDGNFGMAPERIIRTAKLDSLIAINDSVSVMVTSEYCRKKSSENERLWKPGRDTVMYHPVFKRKNKIKDIKSVLSTEFYFRNDVDDVVFIGFDEQLPKPKKDEQGKVKEDKRKNNEYSGVVGGGNGKGGSSLPDSIIFLPLILFLATPLLFLFKAKAAQTKTA